MQSHVHQDSLTDMKNSTLFGEEVTSLAKSTTNHNAIIQSAYDKMKQESSGLGQSPSDSLSRRLDKELRLRRRRSGEGRVIRSPSERKIGNIRRRSRELELKQNVTSQSFCASPVSRCVTPRMKSALLKSPLTQSLKRGRPNAVRCGLPLVARPLSPLTTLSRPLFDLEAENCHFPTAEKKGSVSSDVTGRSHTSSITSMPSFGSSPGGSDCFPTHLQPGVNIDCSTSSLDCGDENWLTAEVFLEQHGCETDVALTDGDANIRLKDGNRPSIAALKKQKMVTANVQLFNQLHTTNVTPNQRRVCRPPASEHRLPAPPRLQQRTRATLTPRQLTRAANLHKGVRDRPRVAVVSPLRENWANTPDDGVFKTPGPPTVTPQHQRRARPLKVPPQSPLTVIV